MSNYYGYALNPNTRKVEKAEFLDNYYGSHQYAVRFDDGGTYKESEVDTNNLKPCYSSDPLPTVKKRTPEEKEQWVKEMQGYAQKEREILAEHEMNQKADDLLPVFLHLYEQYLGWIEEWNAECKTLGSPSGTYYHRSFDGFMQYLATRNKSITP